MVDNILASLIQQSACQRVNEILMEFSFLLFFVRFSPFALLFCSYQQPAHITLPRRRQPPLLLLFYY